MCRSAVEIFTHGLYMYSNLDTTSSLRNMVRLKFLIKTPEAHDASARVNNLLGKIYAS